MDRPPEPLAEGLSAERRDRILAGASAIFEAQGYEGASMSQIAASANVSKGTLYNYFPSKHALFVAFVRLRSGRFVQNAFGDLRDGAPVRLELKRFARIMLNAMLAPAGQAIFRVVVMEAQKFPELVKTFMAEGPEEMVSRLTSWLILKNRTGFLSTPDPRFAAEQFFTLAQTRLVLRARIDPAFTASEADIEQVLEGTVAVFLAAYGVAK